MAEPMIISIANGFYQSPSLPFSNQRCVNLYPVIPQLPSLTDSALFDTGGIREVTSLGNDTTHKSRGAWLFDGKPFVVASNALFVIDRRRLSDGTYRYEHRRIGPVQGVGRCSFAGSKNELIIIDDEGVGYIFSKFTNALVQISDGGFYANGTPRYPVCVDGYFIVVTSDNKAIISSSGDGTDWNALDVITAEADPDAVVAPFVLNNQLYITGQFTTESYENIGGAGVPFRRINGYLLSVGCSAPHSIVQVGSLMFWVGNGQNERPGVYAFDGSQPQRISTDAIDDKINQLTDTQVSGIFSWAYSTNGHSFVAFTTAKNTFVFDISTKRWHERVSIDDTGVNRREEIPCRILDIVTAFNELIVTDVYDGRIGLIDESYPKEYDTSIPRYFTIAPLFNSTKSFSLPYVELICESGVGNSMVPDPEVTLEISRDGVVFDDPQTRLLGRRAEHSVRQIWYKQGRLARQGTLRVRTYSPVKCSWYSLALGIKA